MATRTILVLTVLAWWGTAVRAEDKPAEAPKKPAPAKMDKRTDQLFRAWKKLDYRSHNLGVVAGSFRMNVEAKDQRSGERKGSATYTWTNKDGKNESSLKWDKDAEALGTDLAREGWAKENIDLGFLPNAFDEQLRGASLTAEEKDGHTYVTVEGKCKGMFRSFLFDPAGVLKKITIAAPGPGGEMQINIEQTHEKVGDLHRLTEEKTTIILPNGIGTVKSIGKYSYKKVDGIEVLDKIVETSTFSGQPAGSRTVSFTDWKMEKKAAE